MLKIGLQLVIWAPKIDSFLFLAPTGALYTRVLFKDKPFVFQDALPPSVKIDACSIVKFLDLLAQHSHCVFIEAHQENLGSEVVEESDEVSESLFLFFALHPFHLLHQNCRPKQECVSLPVYRFLKLSEFKP